MSNNGKSPVSAWLRSAVALCRILSILIGPRASASAAQVTLIRRYRDAGLSRISYDFYEGGRHEMLNEINRDEVVANLIGWTVGVLNARI